MRLALCLALLAILAPVATAQVPEDPVGVVCDVIGGTAPDARDALPVCPDDEPAAPAQGEDTDASHQHASPAPEQEAAALVDQARDAVQSIPEDPAGAPNRVADLVASIVAFVRGLLEVPGAIADAIVGTATSALDGIQKAFAVSSDATLSGVRAAAHGIADGARAAVDGVASAARAAVEGVRSLLSAHHGGEATRGAPALPSLDGAAPQTDGLLRGVSALLD